MNPFRSVALTSSPVASKSSLNFPSGFSVNTLPSSGKSKSLNSGGNNTCHHMFPHLVDKRIVVEEFYNLFATTYSFSQLVPEMMLFQHVFHRFSCSLFEGLSFLCLKADDSFFESELELLCPYLPFQMIFQLVSCLDTKSGIKAFLIQFWSF
jgi:hypothetical protein